MCEIGDIFAVSVAFLVCNIPDFTERANLWVISHGFAFISFFFSGL